MKISKTTVRNYEIYDCAKWQSTIGEAIERGHKCRGCGGIIYGRYNYCMSCAQRKGFIKNDY